MIYLFFVIGFILSQSMTIVRIDTTARNQNCVIRITVGYVVKESSRKQKDKRIGKELGIERIPIEEKFSNGKRRNKGAKPQNQKTTVRPA